MNEAVGTSLRHYSIRQNDRTDDGSADGYLVLLGAGARVLVLRFFKLKAACMRKVPIHTGHDAQVNVNGGVHTAASNIKGKTFEFGSVLHPTSCVDWSLVPLS